MASYCWGDRHQPHKILSESETHFTVSIDGEPKQLPRPLIQGRIDAGQRVRVLVSGGSWKNGVVLDGDRLRVRFDSGEEREIYNANWMRVTDNKPPVIIETSSESIINPSKHVEKSEVGPCQFCAAPATLLCDGRIKGGTCDRPLCREHAKHLGNSFFCNRAQKSKGWTDTVDLCPDCVTALERKKQPKDLLNASTIAVGSRVRHDRFWKDQIGFVKEIQGETAMLWFRDGVPLYPAAIAHLQVVE